MPTNNKKIIAISADVNVCAAEADGESKGPAKFEAQFYTGGAMNIAGYELPVVIDLAGLSRGNVLVANLDHDGTKRVGNFDVTNDGKTLVAHGTATAATAARDEVVNSAKDGYQWQASLEVVPSRIETLAKNKTAKVNGQEITGPAYITRAGTLKGFGFVSHGADDNTTVAIAASAASNQEKKMKAEVREWIEARFPSVDIEAMSAEEVANWEADYEGREGVRKPAAKQIATSGDSISKELLNAKRIEELDTITANYLGGISQIAKTTAFLQSVADLKARAVEEGWSPEKYDLELLRNRVPDARPVKASDTRKLSNDVLEAAICMAGGLKNIDDHYSDQALQTAKDRFRGGIGLNELFKICAADNGYHADGYRIDLPMQRAAFGQLPQQNAATGFSTLSLSGILGNSAYKFMLEGWGGGEMAWAAVSDITSVRDFKQITQYRLGGTLKYEKVGPGGEIKHGTVSETSYTLQAETYGKMFAVTRTDYINDDLSALTAVPRELGYGANESFNEVFWTAWLGNTWDYTSSGAISASAALTSIAAAEAAFFALTKPNGEPVTITPNVMLMPNGSYRIAKNAMASALVTGGSSTVPVVNTLAQEYNVVRSAYLSNSAYSGYSATAWYLCAVRPGFAPIQTAFLNGQQSPTIETTSADFNTLGVQMRGVHDFGVSIMEERACVKGSGA